MTGNEGETQVEPRHEGHADTQSDDTARPRRASAGAKPRARRRAPACPRCGTPSVPILYGMPSPEAVESVRRGELAMGGCCIGQDDPDRACPACQHQWLAKRPRVGRRREGP